MSNYNFFVKINHIACAVFIATGTFFGAKSSAKEPVNILVYVHGSINIAELFKHFRNFLDVLRGNETAPYYAHTAQKRLDHTILTRSILTLEEGLIQIHAPQDPLCAENGAELLFSLMDGAAKLVGSPIRYDETYIYNWSGFLHEENRKKYGLKLYEALQALKNEYLQRGKEPHFTLIGYSHGGNVALNMLYAEHKEEQERLHIDTLLLLGTPIHSKTEEFMWKHPASRDLFNKVLCLYSQADIVQGRDIAAPGSLLGTRKYFPERILRPRNAFNIKVSLRRDRRTVPLAHRLFSTFIWGRKPRIIPPIVLYSPMILSLLHEYCDQNFVPLHNLALTIDIDAAKKQVQFLLYDKRRLYTPLQSLSCSLQLFDFFQSQLHLFAETHGLIPSSPQRRVETLAASLV